MFFSKIIILVLSFLLLSSCGSNHGIVNAYAFMRESLPGTILTDESNRTVGSRTKKDYWILLETDSATAPQFTTAWISGEAFTLKALPVQHNKIALGKKRNSEEEVVIQADPGNKLWLFSPIKKEQLKPTGNIARKTKKNAVVLAGKRNNKNFDFKIKRQDTLATLYMQ